MSNQSQSIYIGYQQKSKSRIHESESNEIKLKSGSRTTLSKSDQSIPSMSIPKKASQKRKVKIEKPSESECDDDQEVPSPPPKKKKKKTLNSEDKPGSVCPIPACKKAFSHREYYKYRNHLEIHEGSKPFMCPYCGFGYEIAIQLLKHVSRQHTK